MKPKRTAELTARPAAHDYREELQKRFARRAAMLNMDYVGANTDQRRPYAIANGIACIDVAGVLCNDPSWWDETGYSDLQDEVAMAADDSLVKGIMLMVNSPGGETDQAFETADLFADAAKMKPMWAVAMPIAYSAAYLLASKAAKIYVPPVTGGVGSIGVYAVHFDYSKMLSDAGIGVTIISAGEGKNERSSLQPLTPDAKQRMAAEIQRLYGEFVASVADGRGMSESAVVKLGAFVYEGSKAAMGAGLADVAGTMESAMGDFEKYLASGQLPTGSAASADDPKSKTKGVRMEPNKGAAADPAKPPTEAELEAIRAEASTQGYTAAGDVIELCMQSGAGLDVAQKFIREKTPMKQVCAELLKLKAAKTDKDTISSEALPGDGSKGGGSALETQKPAKTLKQIAEEKYRREGVIK